MSAVVAVATGAAVGAGVFLVVAGVRGRRALPELQRLVVRCHTGAAAGPGRRWLWLAVLVAVSGWLATGWLAAGAALAFVVAAVPRLFGTS
jgi:hypothetical protein